MALVVGDAAEVRMLQAILGAENLWLRLFVNDRDPSADDGVLDYTEMSTHGYAPKNLLTSGWVFTQGAPSNATYATALSWVFTGAPVVNVYGYYIVGQVSGVLYWAERFSAAPFPVQVPGDEIEVLARLTLRSETND